MKSASDVIMAPSIDTPCMRFRLHSPGIRQLFHKNPNKKTSKKDTKSFHVMCFASLTTRSDLTCRHLKGIKLSMTGWVSKCHRPLSCSILRRGINQFTQKQVLDNVVWTDLERETPELGGQSSWNIPTRNKRMKTPFPQPPDWVKPQQSERLMFQFRCRELGTV